MSLILSFTKIEKRLSFTSTIIAMKRFYFLFFVFGFGLGAIKAQNDDVYFIPNKEQKAQEKAQYEKRQKAKRIYNNEENWAEGRGNGNFDVDRYNRRNSSSSAQYDREMEEYYDNNYHPHYTDRLVRFHAPYGIFMSSPYYWDYYSYGLSPYDAPWSWDMAWHRSWSHGWWYWERPWFHSWRWNYYPWSYWDWGWSHRWGRSWGYSPLPPIIRPRGDIAGYKRGPVGGGRYYSVNGQVQTGRSNAETHRIEYQRNIPQRSFDKGAWNNRTAGRSYQGTTSTTSRYESSTQQRSYTPAPSSSSSRSYGGFGSGGGSIGNGRSTSSGNSGGSGRSFGR